MSQFNFRNRCQICDVGFEQPYLLQRHYKSQQHNALANTKNLGVDDTNIFYDDDTVTNENTNTTQNSIRRKNLDKVRKNLENKKSQSLKYNCEFCKYCCNFLSEWKKHVNTTKHIDNTKINNKDSYKYVCVKCNERFEKNYKLKYHNSKCVIIEEPIHENTVIENQPNVEESKNQNIINLILEQNKIMMEIVKTMAETKQNTLTNVPTNSHNTMTNSNNNNSNNITNNQQFNIQLFLDEKCKNAMNLSDFIKSIEITNEDIENNAKYGFVNGITKILSDHWNTLSVCQRPIHCTDPKRETVFIKEENQWSKEDRDKKLNSAIRETSLKSLDQLFNVWKPEHPENIDLDSHDGELCMAIQMNSMGGLNYDKYYEKVRKNLIKVSVLDKKTQQELA